jgi:hypothetical protein
MRVVALQAAASAAMAAQRMMAMQVAVLQAAALQMTAWWASLAVLAALVAVRQVRARSDRGDLAVGGRLIVSPGKSTGLKAAKAVAVAFSGDITGSAGCGAWMAVEAAEGGVTRTGASGAAVAALPRLRRRQWRRRRFPAAAADPAGTGKMHDRDRVWRPAAWLKATRALRPLAKHRSYSAINSADVTAGCCSGRALFTALASSPLAMLAHMVARGEL